MKPVLKLEQIAKVNGKVLGNSYIDALDREKMLSIYHRKELTEYLAKHPKELKVFNTKEEKSNLISDQFKQLLIEADLLEESDTEVKLKNPEHQYIKKNQWLEEYAFLKAIEVREELNDSVGDVQIYANVSIEHQDSHKKKYFNEIDVLLIHNNKLLIIECKNQKTKEGSVNETLYKVDSLKRFLAGVMGKSIIVYAQELETKEATLINERASISGQTVLIGQEIFNIKEEISSWLKSV